MGPPLEVFPTWEVYEFFPYGHKPLVESEQGRIQSPGMGEDRLLTLAEASEVTGYTQRQLRRLAHDKVLPAELYGKTYLVWESALDRFRETYQPDRGRPRGSKNKRPPTPT